MDVYGDSVVELHAEAATDINLGFHAEYEVNGVDDAKQEILAQLDAYLGL